MRIYARMIPPIAREIVNRLTNDGDIEVESHLVDEAELDVGSVMRSYVEEERKLNEEVKEILERRALPYGEFSRIKKLSAEKKNFKLGDEGIEWVVDQMLEFFLVSRNIQEVFAEDQVMRKKIFEILKKYLDVDEDIDREARERIRNLQEGTPQWEIEYDKLVAQLKRSRGVIR